MISAIIAQQFDIEGYLVSVEPLGSGNVNDTYIAIFRTVFDEHKVVIQRINKTVFTKPEELMQNMHLVTEHAHQRLREEHDDAERIWQLPKVIPSKAGKDFIIDDEGEYWRAITRIASAHSYDAVQNINHALEIGSVLGNFHHILSDIPCDQLYDTLPGFHITPEYFKKLDDALATPAGKARLQSSQVAKNVMKFIELRREWSSFLENAKARGEVQLRPIHGDPKTANVMIDDATSKGTAIIDLDTVKPGLILYDIGDCLRSCCNPAGEECTDFTKIYFDVDFCFALLNGYQQHSKGLLTDFDKEHIYDAARLITYELALRFFADYLAGDVYFKTKYDGQNLHRARVQVQLCRSIEANESKIRRTLELLFKE